MQKSILKTLFLTVFMSIIAIFASSCVKARTIKTDDNSIIIIPQNSVMKITENTTLKEYMDKLTEMGELKYTLSDGFILTVNDKAPDSSKKEFWAVYTSDKDNSNTAWGQIEYEGNVYGSSTLGINSLIIKEGETYIISLSTY